jgi:hypothetical protein
MDIVSGWMLLPLSSISELFTIGFGSG